MTAAAALLVQQWTTDGLGHEDIAVRIVRLGIPVTPADRREIKRYVLNLKSLVVKRYGS